MYSSKPSIVYGFHGLDKKTALKIVTQKDNFKHSNNPYDWLGYGIYFWENNYQRAIEYANEDKQRKKSKVKEPFVLGAVIELGRCLDLLDQNYINFLKAAFEDMQLGVKEKGKELPQNTGFGKSDFDFRKRELDCALIRYACNLAMKNNQPFDSVRSAFLEGERLYDGAMFYEKNHIQIAIINPNCIKGIFLPREKVEFEGPVHAF
ncbi:hypothetical protein ABIC12_002732 [Pantoea agglomerans]|jgi:hypothetical protein|uniref:hypothetical protein n=1 Tax=Enterobacter agglomerans TaxID=549 RepID=UPI003394FA3B